MAKMKAVQLPKAGADFETVEREIPQPGAGHVRIQVQACGICHSDVITKEGLFPGITYPRVPGHEVAGVIDELGAGVKEWLLFGKKGIKGWAGGIPTDSQDTLRFAEMTAVRPMIEKYPLAKAAEGYARMISGKAEFRVVLTI